ncbi:shikimate kinase [uncultured Paludibaculum sp.]|uniref:shikimate kinase n=1 Tax=uncultured Paludibaculum sp. TaxID=1765020 RepID=UPI002AAB2D84|nr:shikimate kinase [uncultured Paludibaculum sp.]
MILKLKRTPGIYLVGFMGSGKTTVGRSLAKYLGWRFADLDEDIEAREQKPIGQIFDQHGEEEFRRIESDALKRRVADVARGVPWVISVGGGCFSQARNFELIQNHGLSIWLDAPLELIRSRVAHSTHRPLARDPEKFETLYWERRPFYDKSDYRVAVGPDGSQGAVDSILKLPIF